MAFKYEQTAKVVKKDHEALYPGHHAEVKRVGGKWFDVECDTHGSLGKRSTPRAAAKRAARSRSVVRQAAHEMGVHPSEVETMNRRQFS